ncbi:MAG: FIST domain containing protein [Gammaproteobacteria bacterium]|nr:FIST domain containing protein [Gammaproteobacteria bacterium]
MSNLQSNHAPNTHLEDSSLEAQSELQIRKGVSCTDDPAVAAAELFDALQQPDMELVLFYCSPKYDLTKLAAALKLHFGDTHVIGCTTAGEITPIGYLEGSLTGVSICTDGFRVVTRRIDNLDNFEFVEGERTTNALISTLQRKADVPSAQNTFGFLLIDGLSGREEAVVSAIYRQVGDIQIFGGSAGDGVSFDATYLYHEGEFHTNCAVFSLIQTSQPFTVFKTQHFVASEEKFVVTEADPEKRIVTEINGVSAGREYARMVGLEVNKLTPLIFATYPVIVKVGGDFYVRSIQKVNEDESLNFFCAIDEGLVLTVARGVDLIENLQSLFQDIRQRIGAPVLVLGCDCILRNLELDQKDIRESVAQIMADNSVIGFATYGEQYNAMHVNQTFTGVAIGSKK